jgi:probable F420-dependent oxidoreductase
MKVGIFHYLSTAYAIDPAVLAKRAEELGFDSFWLPEHPIMPVTTVTPFPLGGPIPAFYADLIDPFVGLARASAVTKTIKLGTGICLVPERNPLLLAKEIATLDHFSGGRVLFGIGAGWLKEETEIMGGDFAHRWTQTQEAVMAMKALWTQEEAEYHGKYYNFPPSARSRSRLRSRIHLLSWGRLHPAGYSNASWHGAMPGCLSGSAWRR